jgi:hypothetical protein
MNEGLKPMPMSVRSMSNISFQGKRSICGLTFQMGGFYPFDLIARTESIRDGKARNRIFAGYTALVIILRIPEV